MIHKNITENKCSHMTQDYQSSEKVKAVLARTSNDKIFFLSFIVEILQNPSHYNKLLGGA